jgi:hypothetical protein
VEVVRRRRLGRGEAHAAVEAVRGRATTLTTYLALAMFDDLSKGGDVAKKLGQWGGDAFMDAYGAANRGAHTGYRGDSMEFLVKDTEKLCQRIRAAGKAA